MREGGYRAWRFQRDMVGGTQWDPQLPSNIENCGIFLLLITEFSLNSEICEREWQHAALLEKPFVPVVCKVSLHPPSPINAHQYVTLEDSPTFGASLITALQNAQPLPWESIPDDWKTWDGDSKPRFPNTLGEAESTSSTRICYNLTVVEKLDILHSAISATRICFESALKELNRLDSRVEAYVGLQSASSFTAFISVDSQPTKGCRVHISADSNGIIYDGNTRQAVKWEFDEIKRQMKDIKAQISANLQAVIDGDENVAAFVRSLDAQHGMLQIELQKRATILDQLGYMSGGQESDETYTIRTTIGKSDGEPVLEFWASTTMPIALRENRICKAVKAAGILSRLFIGNPKDSTAAG